VGNKLYILKQVFYIPLITTEGVGNLAWLGAVHQSSSKDKEEIPLVLLCTAVRQRLMN